MTFIIGIGDRHLENILINNKSQLFHIDFGFIFGKDPKPLPPSMKISKEMIDAIGGEMGLGYKLFQTYCCIAYNILRKESYFILDLFTTMVTAGLPDFIDEPTTRLNFVRDRLQIDLSEEQADCFLQRHIDESLHAFLTVISDKVHKWATQLK
eukprot:UN01736